MKKISKILLLLALIVMTACAVTACGGEQGLSIKKDRMPQLVHVLGEELNLADGVLLYTSGEKTEEIAMNADGVEVSGFDKSTLGEQTVTIKYGNATTTLKVTVVPRMTVEGYTADYIVGDKFDTDNGTLKITRNDGTSFTVILKSDKVSIEGFDTSSVGELSLTAKYTNGSTVYTCEFPAKVHAIDNISFKAPNKVAYNSHDGALDVSGGYFTLSGKNGTIKRDVPLTADMVKGYDISLVNETNTPLTQKLTVTYGEKTFEYSVKLTYTDISLFKKNAAPLIGISWSDNYLDILENDAYVPKYTKEQGIIALEMIEKYLDMSPAERTFITVAETLAVARTAMAYGFSAWADEINKYNDAFAIEYGDLVFKCESREALEAAIEGLSVTTSPLYTYSPVLLRMMEAFEEENVYADITFADYPIFSSDYYVSLIDLFEYMVELDDITDAVKPDWKTNINAYADEIEAVYDAIVNSDYYSYDFAQFFYYVSMWRPEDDVFDFLYSYYYDVQNDVSAIIKIANIRLPSRLEEMFAYIYEAMTLIGYISDDTYFAQVPDTTQFFYNYYMAQKLARNIVNSQNEEDKMLQVLFYGLPLNSLLGMSAEEGIYTFDDIIGYINTAPGGYYSLCGALLDVPEFDAVMEKYLNIIVKDFENESYTGSSEYIADVKAMFALYTKLSPSQQFNFLGILSTYYVRGYMPLAFDNVTEGYSQISTIFVDMVNSVYTDMFESEDAKNAYLQLIFATEIYAQRYIYSAIHIGVEKTWLVDFSERMNAVATALGKMPEADKALFNAELGELYATYADILESYKSSGSSSKPDLGEWADDFAELEDAILKLELAYAIISEGDGYYDMFFTAYERVLTIANRILNDPSVPKHVKEAFLYSELYSTSSLDKILNPEFVIDPAKEVFWSYDYVISVYRSMYVNALLTIGGDTSLYDYYQIYGFDRFMNMAYDVIWAYMGSEKDAEDIFEKDKVLGVMNEFCKMDVNAQMMFILYIEGEYGLYYTAVSEFLYEEFSANVAAAGELLVALEMDAIIYNYYGFMLENESASEADLKEAAEALTEAYAALTEALSKLTAEEQNEFNAAFGDILAVYEALAESVSPAAVA